MRGSPWLRLLLMLLALALMGWAVARVTRTESAPATVPAGAAADAPKTLAIRVVFAHPPSAFTLHYLGRPILEGKGKAEFAGAWRVALPAAGADLLLKAAWPPGTPRTAVAVRIEGPDGYPLADKTYWGSGMLTEIVPLQP